MGIECRLEMEIVIVNIFYKKFDCDLEESNNKVVGEDQELYIFFIIFKRYLIY